MTDRVNIAASLHRWRIDRPYQAAIYQPSRTAGLYHRVTFVELWNLISDLMPGLKAQGISRGTRAVLMIPPSIDFVIYTFALFRLGAIPVFVDPGMGFRNLGKCLEEAQPEAFIGVRKAHLARWLFRWANRWIKIKIASGKFGIGAKALDGNFMTGWVNGPAPTNDIADTTADDFSAILFTSGSTGVPKGAVYTHGMFQTQLEKLQQAFSIEAGEYDLCTFPLFALFGPALGMTSVVPQMDFTRPASVHPMNIINPVQAFGVTNLFGSPALLNQVAGGLGEFYEEDQGFNPDEYDLVPYRMPSVKRVLSAGAPVAPAILEQFSKLIPEGTQIYTPYGATEALPVAVIGSHEVLQDTRHQTARGAGTCVGRPVAGLEVRIIRISDEPIAAWSDDLVLPPGEIGEIAVSGPQVTQEYFRRPDLTALAKIPDAARGRKWHRMGDVGYFDDQGRLWFCGRKSQRVITPQRTYFTEPVEGIFNTVPGVFRTALVGVKRDGEVRPVLCVELERGAKPQVAMRDELLQCGSKFELTREIRSILFHPRFPVDIRHNSKIFREKLAVWAVKKRF